MFSSVSNLGSNCSCSRFLIRPSTVKCHSGRIVGGENAPAGLYPYQISLQIKGPTPPTTVVKRINWLHNCGGSIVTRRNVVTAAHCVTGWIASDLSIWAGTTRLNGDGFRYMVQAFLVHPKYVRVNTSDIAIVTTSVPIVYITRRVRTRIRTENCCLDV